MGEKKEGKENKKCSTMPNVLIKGYKILRTVRVGQDFSLVRALNRFEAFVFFIEKFSF